MGVDEEERHADGGAGQQEKTEDPSGDQQNLDSQLSDAGVQEDVGADQQWSGYPGDFLKVDDDEDGVKTRDLLVYYHRMAGCRLERYSTA